MNKGKKIAIFIAAGFVILIILGAIFGEDTQIQESQPNEQQTQQTETIVQQPAAEQVASKCLDVPKATLEAIESGAEDGSGVKVVRGKAVKSTDFNNVFFVATEIQAPGIEAPNDIAVFDTNSIDDTSIIDSVNATAKALFVWPDDTRTSSEDDGYQEAIDCL